LLEKGVIKSVGDSFARKTSGNKKAHGLVKKNIFHRPTGSNLSNCYFQ